MRMVLRFSAGSSRCGTREPRRLKMSDPKTHRKPDMKTIKNPLTGVAAAELMGVSPDTISRWCRDGMPHSGGGQHGTPLQIDIPAAMRWLNARAAARHSSEQERLSAERADAVALHNAEQRRQLILADHVRHAVEHLQDGLSDCLELPAGLPERIAATSDPARIRAMLQDWTRSVRTRYAAAVPAVPATG